MSSAAARAEARRKAILSRGTDRLAKLTTSSGRPEDAPVPGQSQTPPRPPPAASIEDPDPPLPSLPPFAPPPNISNFLGEESPALPRSRVSSTTGRSRTTSGPSNPLGMPDPSAWSPEQQEQFMAAMMGGLPPQLTSGASTPGAPPSYEDSMPPPNPFAGMPGMENNPLAAMLMSAAGGGGPFSGETSALPSKPKTLLQRVLPLVHIAAVWALVLYFVIIREPSVYMSTTGWGLGTGKGVADRWERLVHTASGSSGVQVMPFFWAFVTLELILHSLRIFSGFDTFRPPTLLAIALPHLPSSVSATIVHGMKYWQMGSMWLDDIAAAIVAVGFVVWLSTWLAV
ncbi:unnamed protein product [Mycena citricolor]|uniref:Uncharacterized protein n=1 Tax=Mycena citricolor TaxID=2018698 RepID=A0AAD2JWF9_9AGAR|nr:unnamed protein product [Mycena citricolor]CAK5279777.1 unnamed protein product [Mycena citricolor]